VFMHLGLFPSGFVSFTQSPAFVSHAIIKPPTFFLSYRCFGTILENT
jgi:hypothetical protein